jgi:AraC-like DNA-binding protein
MDHAWSFETLCNAVSRLERTRAAIERGVPIAQAAADPGFADQSHLTRHFKRAYGITPGHWAAAATG